MLMFTLGVFIYTDGVTNGCISAPLSEVIVHLKKVLEVLGNICSVNNVVFATDTVAGKKITYSVVNFGGIFLDYNVDDESLLIHATPEFITGLRNHINALEVSNER